MADQGSRCREHSHIPADQLEEVVFTEVKGMLQNPDLILASLKSMDSEDDGGLAKQLARVEKDLKKVQVEDSRAVGLYVSGKITERELDHQREFIGERMETARAKVEDYRAQASMKAEKKAVAGNIVGWANKIGVTVQIGGGRGPVSTQRAQRARSFFRVKHHGAPGWGRHGTIVAVLWAW